MHIKFLLIQAVPIFVAVWNLWNSISISIFLKFRYNMDYIIPDIVYDVHIFLVFYCSFGIRSIQYQFKYSRVCEKT